VDFQLGSRETKTGNKLWRKLKNMDNNTIIATDYWKAYRQFIPKNRHTQSKAETFTVESYNSVLRHYLARLKRKTKCYSKSYLMLKLSILMLMIKHNYGLVNLLSML
jgi:IS1 family transposase